MNAGFTDHVFALCHLLGFRFAPRIRHIGETRLFSVEKPSRYPTLEKLIGGTIHTKQITAHWDEVLRLASSIQQGTVTASLMLRKLGARKPATSGQRLESGCRRHRTLEHRLS